MSAEHPVTAVVINFQTPDLLRTAVASLRRFYPGLPLLIIDNGSKDESPSLITDLSGRSPGAVRAIFNASNLHHGPAMDQALRNVTTPFVLFLDSDCEVVEGGFVEAMLDQLQSRPKNYAVGQRILMDRRGFDLAESAPDAIAYIRPLCMMLRRETYLALPRFQLHGTPCLENMSQAGKDGFGLVDFPVSRYVSHRGRGTAGRHGYGLGLRGKINHFLHKLGL